MNIRSHDHDPDHEPPSGDVFAGEYVLGVLDSVQWRQAQARTEAEPAFARLVADWERRLASLIDEIEPIEVPAHVWLRVCSGLGWSPMEGAHGGLLQRVGFWRGATAGALAIAAVLAVVAILRPAAVPVTPPTPPIVTVPLPIPAPIEPASEMPKPVVILAREDGQTGWLAAVDAADGELTMVPVPSPDDPAGRVGELWLIPAGEAPQSLGFVSNERAHTIKVPAALRDELAAGATLAITLEPEEGIPHAAPSGPIIASGQIATI